MFKRIVFAVPLVAASLAVAAGQADAQWQENGMAVCNESAVQAYSRACSDCAGGAIIAWVDYRGSGNTHIYAQRIDPFGRPLWAPNGIPVTTYDSYQYNPQIVSDGQGGAIVVWDDQRYGARPFAERLGPDGARLWDPAGVALTTSTYGSNGTVVAPDGHGGLLATWYEYRTPNKVYAQRVSAGGTLLWGSGATAVCSSAGDQWSPWIDTDGSFGAFIAWHENRSGNYDIYMNRIKANGTVMWSTGVTVCSAANSQTFPCLVYNGTESAIIAWQDNRSGSFSDIYAARIDTLGSGYVVDLQICTAYESQDNVRLAPDGSGGAYLAWQDFRNGYYTKIWAQHMEKNGTLLWPANGSEACGYSASQWDLQVMNDGAGNLIVAWTDGRDNEGDVYCQKLGPTLAIPWGSDGVPVCAYRGGQGIARIATDMKQGVIVTWTDGRVNPQDIYAQRIERSGYWGYPCAFIDDVADVPFDQGGEATVSWNASRLDVFGGEVVTHYSIWRSLDPRTAASLVAGGARGVDPAAVGKDFKGPAYRFETMAGALYGWEWVGNQDAHYFSDYTLEAPTYFDSTSADPATTYFLVSAHTSDRFVFWDSPVDSGCSVDNLAPCAPLELEGEQEYDPAALRLTWRRGSEGDLEGYAVYRGMEEGFAPAPDNIVSLSCDTFFVDGSWRWDAGYFYKVSAIDVHGNESGFALLRPGDVTGTENAPLPAATRLAQNFPNPFNPSTAVAFDLASSGRVTIGIYDASGRLVTRLVDGVRPAGRYRVEWNGRARDGASAASGVYFCRMEAAGYSATRKMVLLK